MPEHLNSSYEKITNPGQKSNPSRSGKLFSALLSVIRCISLFLIWPERLWKKIKIIWRTTNIRFMFSSKNPPFLKKAWKRLYCPRNTSEHLHFVLGVAIWSSCLLLSIDCVPYTEEWLPLEWLLRSWLSCGNHLHACECSGKTYESYLNFELPHVNSISLINAVK